MEKTGIINFGDFFKNNDSKKNFNKEDFKDFFLPEDSEQESITESLDNEELENEPQEEEDQEETIKEEPLMGGSKSSHTVHDAHMRNLQHKEDETDERIEIESNESNSNYYSVFKDKSEDFSCDISIEGADLNETQARLIIESDEWILMFNGEINNKGKCVIPIKKLGILNEGTTGKIRLEVIADGTVFTPWEDDFKVKVSKKVAVKIHESKSNPKKTETKKATGVKVNVKR